MITPQVALPRQDHDPTQPAGRARIIAAVTVGNALEAFDFTVYTFYAILIGKLFFPAADPTNQLLLSVATFGVGFVVRPLGGIVMGSYADRHGRKAAMSLTILLMGAGCLIIGLAPTYGTAGMAAPLAIVVARLLQGFSAGGEMGAAVTLLVENGTPRDRSFIASWFVASQGLGIMCGAALAAGLAFWLPADALETWGWRVPFLLGVAIVPVGLYIRRHLPDTLAGGKDGTPGADAGRAQPLRKVLRHHKREVSWGVLLIMGSTVSAYLLLHMPTYGMRELGLPAASALLAGIASSGVSMLAAPVAGKLADRWGRTPLILAARCASIAIIYPCFLWLAADRTLPVLLLVVSGLSLLYTLHAVPALTMLAEMMARQVRATGTSVATSIGLSLFGGTTQLFVVWLIAVTGSAVSPAFFLMAALALSVLPLAAIRDRTGQRLDAQA